MPKTKATASIATRIAQIDKGRLNEAIAAGFYECAPKTIAGQPRVFDVQDMIALRVYSRLTEEGMRPASAGPVACKLRSLLAEYPGADCVVHVVTSIGSSNWFLLEHFDRDAVYHGGLEILSFREWRFGWLRTRIMNELNEEDKIARDPADTTED